MEKENAMRGSLLTVSRRFAAGIDVSEDAVRLAIISRRLKANSSICVERLETVPLDEGVVVRGDFLDRPAIVAALRTAFERLPVNGTRRALRCAMGLPSSATHTLSVPLTQLIEPRKMRMSGSSGDPSGVLEPAVLAEAERALGMERASLAVDWSVQRRSNGLSTVSIAATQRRFVEARVEVAAQAGIALSAIDGEPGSALRAMRHAGSTEFDADSRYLVCWAESTGMHGWVVNAGEIENEGRYPTPEFRTIGEALRDLAGDAAPPHCIYVGGNLELMERGGFSTLAISALFDCPTLPFEAAPFCNGAANIDDVLKHSPRFAVAFGLALREVLQ
ncbi:pilus assembly protein PilM [Caballeronia sp. BR00000012568055]|uniref:type IV pilus biogenesis protein PilM n=1 Tax=Caballeronia sp. BR00000012568055 TaxID=2918761 RepID=UPI0023F8FC1A|nr:pilus assembly protein PilM [Caballeronia sp. BR00000012568055]